MLRIGKNKDQEENDHSNHKPEVPDYSTAKTYSYQGTGVEAKPAPEPAATSASRAMTESETLARDIKEGTLSGFVGGGTVVTGEANFKAMMRVDGHLSGRVSSSSGTLIVGANGKVDAKCFTAGIHLVVTYPCRIADLDIQRFFQIIPALVLIFGLRRKTDRHLPVG